MIVHSLLLYFYSVFFAFVYVFDWEELLNSLCRLRTLGWKSRLLKIN